MPENFFSFDPRGAPNTHGRGVRKSLPNAYQWQLHDRAHKLIVHVWQEKRWSKPIKAKLPAYLQGVLFKRKGAHPPQGVPGWVLDLVHRCIAQACIELEAEHVPCQKLDWYDAAEAAARVYMLEHPGEFPPLEPRSTEEES